jgi:gas vesicle protein
VADEDPRAKILGEIIKNPTIFILILAFLGYVDIRTLPSSLEKIGAEGTENLASIKDEISYLRKDIREQIEEVKANQEAIHKEISETKARISTIEKKNKQGV